MEGRLHCGSQLYGHQAADLQAFHDQPQAGPFGVTKTWQNETVGSATDSSGCTLTGRCMTSPVTVLAVRYRLTLQTSSLPCVHVTGA